jgi:hydrogenase expression/formation protein HypD
VKYLDEYRDPVAAEHWVEAIGGLVTRPWTLMEVCGGQTHAILKYGLDELLPSSVTLLHGPGCPVCVTPLEKIDRAIAIASRPEVVFCSFGDMLRVPGTDRDLLSVKAAGGDVRIVYSPLDALKIARDHPDRQVVFFAVGFETTAPGNAMSVYQAKRQGVRNFSILVSHVLVPPALEAILSSPSCRVQGFLAAGHVCAVMGYREYIPIAERHRVPIVVTGFEPLDLLEGILMAIRQLETGRAVVENQYARAVTREGNREAQDTVFRVFEVGERTWRGIGMIPASGYHLRPEFARFDAETRFEVGDIHTQEHPACIAGQILQGTKTPLDCAAYGVICSPQKPLGAPMVSSEGVCSAYHAAGRGLAAPSAFPLYELSGGER